MAQRALSLSRYGGLTQKWASRLNNRQGLARALRRGVPFGNPLILLAAMSVGIDFREFSPQQEYLGRVVNPQK